MIQKPLAKRTVDGLFAETAKPARMLSTMAGDTVVLPCPRCLGRNRVPRARLGDVPICPDCRTRLLPEAPVALDESSFDRYTQAADLPVIVDFWADWCGPCRTMAPHFAAAAKALAGRALLAKVDTEAARGLAARFSIQGIPTIVLLDHGRELARESGALSQKQIEAWVAAHLTAGST